MPLIKPNLMQTICTDLTCNGHFDPSNISTDTNRTTKENQKLCGSSASNDSIVVLSTNNIVLSDGWEFLTKLDTKE